jgi:hypothetical protein
VRYTRDEVEGLGREPALASAPVARTRLESRAKSEPRRQRLHWLEMDIVDGCRLVRQLRGVEVVDLVGFEQVQDVEPNPRLFLEFIPDAQIGERCGSGSYAAVLDQRGACQNSGSEARRTKDRGPRQSRSPSRPHWGIRDVITGMPRLGVIRAGVDIGETRPAGGEIGIEPEPGKRLIWEALSSMP